MEHMKSIERKKQKNNNGVECAKGRKFPKYRTKKNDKIERDF
jgi:hypothetical protein